MIPENKKSSFSLIVCTYQRPFPMLRLLKSVEGQSLIPNQIIIVDGSLDFKTGKAIEKLEMPNLEYFPVKAKHRGLTKQRNFGLDRVNRSSEIICFLDDDIILERDYFLNLIETYKRFPDAMGVGGYIADAVEWKPAKFEDERNSSKYYIDGYERNDSSRFILRRKLGLLQERFPTVMPEAGHGRSVGFLPPSGRTYEVETFMGGVASYKKKVFENIRFSAYFEGYGLYEDTDFTLRLSQLGKLYLNTAARLYHFHEEDGRPNKFTYGKMVVRNGWYVWRIKYSSPKFQSKVKWHLIEWVLILIRLGNTFSTVERKQALTESLGRIAGWISLFIKEPKSLKNDQEDV